MLNVHVTDHKNSLSPLSSSITRGRRLHQQDPLIVHRFTPPLKPSPMLDARCSMLDRLATISRYQIQAAYCRVDLPPRRPPSVSDSSRVDHEPSLMASSAASRGHSDTISAGGGDILTEMPAVATAAPGRSWCRRIHVAVRDGPSAIIDGRDGR